MRTSTTSLLLLPLVLAAMPAAHAQDATTRQNAAGMCQGALPQFAGTLRARPLAVANDGASDAFVTCSMVGENGRRYQFINPLFINRSGTPVSVACTVVTGHAHTTARYYTRNVAMAPGAGGSFELTPDANDPANLFNMNCKLPPGVELNYVRLDRQAP